MNSDQLGASALGAVQGAVFFVAAMLVWGDPGPDDYDHYALYPAPGGQVYCRDGQGTDCYPNPANRGWPINTISDEQYCDYWRHHPGREHIGYVFTAVAHCWDLSGTNIGGYDDGHCRGGGGAFGAGINLKADFGQEKVRYNAYACSKASGVPKEVLWHAVPLEGQEEYPANCPDHAKWTHWHEGQTVGAVKGLTGEIDVPVQCYTMK